MKPWFVPQPAVDGAAPCAVRHPYSVGVSSFRLPENPRRAASDCLSPNAMPAPRRWPSPCSRAAPDSGSTPAPAADGVWLMLIHGEIVHPSLEAPLPPIALTLDKPSALGVMPMGLDKPDMSVWRRSESASWPGASEAVDIQDPPPSYCILDGVGSAAEGLDSSSVPNGIEWMLSRQLAITTSEPGAALEVPPSNLSQPVAAPAVPSDDAMAAEASAEGDRAVGALTTFEA